MVVRISNRLNRSVRSFSCQAIGLIRAVLIFLMLPLIFSVFLTISTKQAIAASTHKHALIIGNQNYKHLSDLKNPVNDAKLMNVTLKQLGFTTTLLANVTNRKMQDQVGRFADSLRSRIKHDEQSVLLFFYAGHGIQNSRGSILLPTEYNPEKPVPYSYLALQDVFEELIPVKVQHKIFIIDACREDDNIANSDRIQASSEYKIPVGSLLAFSTGPNTVAQDGLNRHSPYVESLATEMREPGADIMTIFQRTRQRVYKLTQGRQLPTETNQMLGEFYFIPGQYTAKAIDFTQADKAHWDRIKDSHSPIDYTDYLMLFPNGLQAQVARTRLAYYRVESPQSKSKRLAKSTLGVQLLQRTQPGTQNVKIVVGQVDPKSVLSGKVFRHDIILQINYRNLPSDISFDPNRYLDDQFQMNKRLHLLIKRGNSTTSVTYHVTG